MSEHAYCDATGQIQIGAFVPGGMLPIARGPARELRDWLQGCARLAYDNETLLVPGVPEAEDQLKAVDALLAWLAWVGRKPPENIMVHGSPKSSPPKRKRAPRRRTDPT